VNDAGLARVIAETGALRERYEAILAKKGIDALLMPRSVGPLPDISGSTIDYLSDQVVGTQVNDMGLPAISVPAGFLDDGRPTAIDIVGRAKFTEAEILAFAYDFEQATIRDVTTFLQEVLSIPATYRVSLHIFPSGLSRGESVVPENRSLPASARHCIISLSKPKRHR
jgi:hypothetical protein